MTTFGLTRTQQIWFILLLILGITVINDFTPRQAIAQDEAVAEKPAEGEAPPDASDWVVIVVRPTGFSKH